MPSIDIIIPAYNSGHVISSTLQSLAQQIIPPNWKPRLMLSDDGSTDDTIHIAQRSASLPGWESPVILRNDHAGASAARNAAILLSRADVILFLGADIVLRPGALAEHCDFHTGYPDAFHAALGFVLWDPCVRPTPLMDWMVHGGPQNNFDDLLDEREADPRHSFYASHVSVKRQMVKSDMFNESFTSYGWEDLELGHRLYKKGLRLVPLPSAVGLHAHHYSPRAIFHRQFMAGKNIHVFQRRVSGRLLPSKTFFHKLSILLINYLGLRATLELVTASLGKHYSFPSLFVKTAAVSFWSGYYS